MQIRPHNNAGFTLIEMLVSLAIFTIVVTMSVGTLLVLINANGRAQSMQLVMTNLSFTLDSMTREVRTGTSWYCSSSANAPTIPTDDAANSAATRDCLDGNYLSIIESGNSLTGVLGPGSTRRITYWYDEDYYGAGHGAILRKLGGPTGTEGDWIALTGPDVAIDTFVLEARGTERMLENCPSVPCPGADQEAPTVTMYIRGRAGFSTSIEEKVFNLQTSVTQRLVDI